MNRALSGDADLKDCVDQCLLDCYWLVNCLVILGKTCCTTTNYKLLLSQVKMDIVRLDSVLRKPWGALWNNLREAIILQKFSLLKTEGSLLLRVQIAHDMDANILSILQEKAAEESLTKAGGHNLFPCTWWGGCQNWPYLGWRDLVCRLIQAGARSDSLLSTQDFWLKEGSKSSLTTGQVGH